MKRAAYLPTLLAVVFVAFATLASRLVFAQPDAGTPPPPAPPTATASAIAPPPAPPPPPPPAPPPEEPKTAKPAASSAVAPVAEPPPVVTQPPPPPPAPTVSAEPLPPPLEVESPADVRVGDTLAFQIKARYGELSAAERASAATKALKDAFDAATPEDVHVERSENVAIVYVAKSPIIQLTPKDALASGDASLEVHADAVAAGVRKAIKAEKDRATLSSRILSISLVILFGLFVVYLVRRIGDFAERANAWVDDNPHRIPAIRVRSLMLLTPAAFRSALAGTIGVGKWFAQFAIGYLWLLSALSLFEATRGYTDKLNSILLQPFVALTTRVASSLPITIVVLIAALVVGVMFRVAGLFFESVRTGATTVEWIPPELARPTSTLVRVALVLTTLVFAGPVLTGNADGALARAGFIGIISLGLASVPIVASCTVGLVVVYGRRYHVGEHVKVGDTRGKVVEIGLADVTVEDDDGNATRIPHLVTLVRPIELLGVAPRVVARIAVKRHRATEALLTKLVDAAAELGADPRVDIENIEQEFANITLSVLSDELDAKTRLHLAAIATLTEDAATGGAPALGKPP